MKPTTIIRLFKISFATAATVFGLFTLLDQDINVRLTELATTIIFIMITILMHQLESLQQKIREPELS